MPPITTTKDLQWHCNHIIKQLENAVQATADARHIKINNKSDLALAEEAKEKYIQAVEEAYDSQTIPDLYEKTYTHAIAEPWGVNVDYKASEGAEQCILYQIEVGCIIQQLNHDFCLNQAREDWVDYTEPYFNALGKPSQDRIGHANYVVHWVDELPESNAFKIEQNIVYLYKTG
ncbi:MAG: hypothetical protein QNK11_05580, partial [Legionella sp.]|nr:hypothetical protein [Legionella sp.]